MIKRYIIICFADRFNTISLYNELSFCPYVKIVANELSDTAFFTTHQLWGYPRHAVTATDADIILFQLDNRYADFKVLPCTSLYN